MDSTQYAVYHSPSPQMQWDYAPSPPLRYRGIPQDSHLGPLLSNTYIIDNQEVSLPVCNRKSVKITVGTNPAKSFLEGSLLDDASSVAVVVGDDVTAGLSAADLANSVPGGARMPIPTDPVPCPHYCYLTATSNRTMANPARSTTNDVIRY
ncbi:unnamed protein product [Callosobruchus maculatus]|uniref:Uncharacterized protein n=1 Tax=Callosobruchus maculatus TaxID=64391 RepID=A0A653CZU8_CALMS|nr:unnamed protein product [Callosobruchus maculatus]